MAMQNYTPMRLSPNLDSGLRNDLLKVDRFLRQLTAFSARVPSAPQGTPPSSGTFDLNNFLYLPGRQGGQFSFGRVAFEAKVISSATGASVSAADLIGFRMSSANDGPTDVLFSIEERRTGLTKTPTREWIFPSLSQTSDAPGPSYFVDADNFQRINKKTLGTTCYEFGDTQGAGFVFDTGANRGTTGVGAQAFNILISGGMATCTWPYSAAGNGATDGLLPVIYMPSLDASAAPSSGGATVAKDKTHVFGVIKVVSGASATPFEDGGIIYGGGARRSLYQMPGRAMGTLAAPSQGSVATWNASVSTTGDFATSSALVTNIPSTTNLRAGMRIRMTTASHLTQLGDDIYIKSVDSATQITLSATYSGANLPTEPFIAFGLTWLSPTAFGGLLDHGTLLGLTDDDHPQYILGDSSSRATGQHLGSGTKPTGGASSADLSTYGRVVIGTSAAEADAYGATGSLLTRSDIAGTLGTATNFANRFLMNLTGSGAAGGGTFYATRIEVSGGSSFTSGSLNIRGMNLSVNPVIPSGVTGQVIGLEFMAAPSGTGVFSLQVGADFFAAGSASAGATGTNLIGVRAGVNSVATAFTNVIAVQAANAGGTISAAVTQATAFDVASTFMNDTDVVTWSGLRISTGLTAAIANKWSLDLTNTSTNMGSRIAHKIALGWNPSTVSAITARAMLAIGTTAAGTAPLKFQSGTNMTAAEAGAVEFTTDDLFFTITTGAARKAFVLDDGTRLTSGRVPFATTNGRLIDDSDMTFATDTLTVTKLVASTNLAIGTRAAVTGVSSTLFDDIADVGNVGTGEDDLFTHTTAASQLNVNADKLDCHVAGIFVSSATATRRLRAYFGGTLIYDSTALSLSTSSDWDMRILVIRESSSVVRCVVSVNTTTASSAPYCQYTRITGLTLSNTNIIKITGEAAGVGAATDDIVAKLGTFRFVPAA